MIDGKFFKMNELLNICGNVALPITFGKSQSQQIYAYTYGSSTPSSKLTTIRSI